MKVVINIKYGGFEISTLVLKELILVNNKYVNQYSISKYYNNDMDLFNKDKSKFIFIGDNMFAHSNNDYIFRNDIIYLIDNIDDIKFRVDKDLVNIVSELKDEANGRGAKLKIVEIPDNIKFEIYEYDGIETIHEIHRSWS